MGQMWQQQTTCTQMKTTAKKKNHKKQNVLLDRCQFLCLNKNTFQNYKGYTAGGIAEI